MSVELGLLNEHCAERAILSERDDVRLPVLVEGTQISASACGRYAGESGVCGAAGQILSEPPVLGSCIFL